MYLVAFIGGFLFWFNVFEKDGKDLQGFGEGLDVVNVLIYYCSKGLEWLVVICYDLENNFRVDFWGIDIILEIDYVDFGNVLGG